MTDRQFWIQTAVLAVGSIGTVWVATLAIWGDVWRRRLVGAKLRIRLLDPLGDPTNLANGADARYYRVVIENLRPHAIATNACVVLTNLVRPNADGEYPPFNRKRLGNCVLPD
jgi:hypothetical protein